MINADYLYGDGEPRQAEPRRMLDVLTLWLGSVAIRAALALEILFP